jgi:hypothetical protein
MPPIFDPDQYTTVPTRSPGATLSLARGLISASSSRPPPSLAKRLVRLRDRAKLLQMSWVDASRPAVATESLRQLDTVLDRRWNAMRGRLDACQLTSTRATPLLPWRSADLRPGNTLAPAEIRGPPAERHHCSGGDPRTSGCPHREHRDLLATRIGPAHAGR